MVRGAVSSYFRNVLLVETAPKGNDEVLTRSRFRVVFDHDQRWFTRVFPNKVRPGGDILERHSGRHGRRGGSPGCLRTDYCEISVAQLGHGYRRVNVACKAIDSVPRFSMRYVNRDILCRKG